MSNGALVRQRSGIGPKGHRRGSHDFVPVRWRRTRISFIAVVRYDDPGATASRRGWLSLPPGSIIVRKQCLWRRSMTTVSRIVVTLGLTGALGMAVSAGALAQTQLKASHQWPGGKGDVRDEMVQIIAREVAAADVGLDVRIYPARVAVQADPAVGRDGRGPARHLGLPARLRERQASAVQRHPDAGPGQEPRARQAAERLAVHGGHQADHRRAGRDGAVGRLARRRLREQGRVRPRAGGRPGQGDALGRAGVRADAGGGRRLDQLDAELGDLHRAADRRARRGQHQLRQLRLVPASTSRSTA